MKIKITSSTSMNGIKLISGSSRPFPLRKFMPPPLLARVVHDVDELDGLLLHLDDEAVDQRAEVAVEDQRRHRDRQAEAGVVQRRRNAVRQLGRIAAGAVLRAEDLDHADHGAEQDRKSTRLNSS